jgi:hypothetical protein
MKRNLKILLIAVLLTAAPVLMMAQTPPHPNGGNTPAGPGNHKVGEGAPIGEGNIILFTLALAFAGRKMYGMRTATEE